MHLRRRAWKKLGWFAIFLVGLCAVSPQIVADVLDQRQAVDPPIYANLKETIALQNDRVVVRRFIVEPGQWTGKHVHSAHQLLVFIKGGVLTSKATGRPALWPDGRVVWHEAAGRDEGSTNTGHAPIEMVWVSLTPARSTLHAMSASEQKYGYLNYPNIPGEDVLENDLVIVQRFKMNPGEWEGIHAHNPNTFYIFIKGGQWMSKSNEHPEGVPGSAVDGVVAWMDTIGMSDQHQSGNVGSNPTEVVWVALKK